MSNLTDFGVAVRKLRLGYGWSMLDLAVAMGLSSSYLSDVERGKRAIPHDMPERVAEAMDLTNGELRELRRAAIWSQPRVTIDIGGLDEDRAELARLLAWKLPTMTERQVESVLTALELAQ